MKIAFCITRMDQYGGAQMHLRDLCLWLHGQGHEIVVLSGWPGRVSDILETQGITFIEIPDLQRAIHPQRDYRAFGQIRDALQMVKPDIVACHMFKAGLLGRMAAKACGIPVVYTAHGWSFAEGVSPIQRIVFWGLEKFASCFGNHIITVCQSDRNLAIKAHLAHPRKITAVHNGVPVVPPVLRGVNSTAPLNLLMVARIDAQKDHQRLLRVLWGCLDMDWTLQLVGGGDDLELRHLVDKMGFADRVHFMGEREDISELMAKADVFVLASYWEGLPLSILEAMRAGLPVIASHVGGISEAVVHGQTGWLVPAGEDAPLLEALQMLFPDRIRLIDMGRQGRVRFEEKFTFLMMAQRTLAVYEMVLAAVKRH